MTGRRHLRGQLGAHGAHEEEHTEEVLMICTVHKKTPINMNMSETEIYRMMKLMYM